MGYLHRVAAGETLVVLESNRPVAEIKPIAARPAFVGARSGSPEEPRPYGLCAGELVTPDDFDAPLPEDVLDTFAGR